MAKNAPKTATRCLVLCQPWDPRRSKLNKSKPRYTKPRRGHFVLTARGREKNVNWQLEPDMSKWLCHTWNGFKEGFTYAQGLAIRSARRVPRAAD